ncbi:cupin domain-containing protein [Ruminococcaceae bacterium OttesenSCG-928-L11]|nr:cupin domain-containing protein [Ruminococcaceae bacterium OttesenSCG-928-L11]
MQYDKLTILRKESLQPVEEQFGEGCAFTRYEAVTEEGGGKSVVRFYDIPPGKANYPLHYHESHEEVFYILSGAGVVITADGGREIRAGDLIVCPPTPGGAHRIVNTSAEVLSYLEFDAVAYPDIAHYPMTHTLGILYRDRAKNQFFSTASTVDYVKDVEGEDK